MLRGSCPPGRSMGDVGHGHTGGVVKAVRREVGNGTVCIVAAEFNGTRCGSRSSVSQVALGRSLISPLSLSQEDRDGDGGEDADDDDHDQELDKGETLLFILGITKTPGEKAKHVL